MGGLWRRRQGLEGCGVIALLPRCLSVPRNKADRGAQEEGGVGGGSDEKHERPTSFCFFFFFLLKQEETDLYLN